METRQEGIWANYLLTGNWASTPWESDMDPLLRKKSRTNLIPVSVAVVFFTIVVIYSRYFQIPLKPKQYFQNETGAVLKPIPLPKKVVTRPGPVPTAAKPLLKPVLISDKLQLDLPHCKIPKIDEHSKRYIASKLKFNSCKDEDEFSTIEHGILTVEVPSSKDCCVREILRPFKMKFDDFQAGPCVYFKSSNSMKIGRTDFISVACNKSGVIVSNLHANVVPSASYLKGKTRYWKNKELPVNVMVLVLDSTSRTDAFRHLPKTMTLLKELNFVDFKGFHHLGEPTLRNAIPLMVGVSTEEFFAKIKLTWEEKWDSTPFIWKEFNALKYATAYIEDFPELGTFNYGGQTGFTFKPTDFYLRPFMMANMDNIGDSNYKMKACIGRKHIVKYILDYQLDMLNNMNGLVPIFSIPWPCWPQHDFPGTVREIENITLDFFQQLKNSPRILENTLIIFMGDHGFYHGPYAQTHEGLMERRLPLFMMRLPKKLTSKYPEFEDRVLENSKRVTSHYDVYKTLLHVAHLSSPNGTDLVLDNDLLTTNTRVEMKFGTSLLNWIPESRTCKEAGIPETNCACNLPFPPAETSSNKTSTLNRVPQVVPSIMKIRRADSFFHIKPSFRNGAPPTPPPRLNVQNSKQNYTKP